MEKKLYMTEFIEKINGLIIEDSLSRLHYGVVPVEKPTRITYITDFDELFKISSHTKHCTLYKGWTSFNKTPFLYTDSENFSKRMKFFKNDFTDYEIIKDVMIADFFAYTIDELKHRLSADEFADWLKDHNFNIIF